MFDCRVRLRLCDVGMGLMRQTGLWVKNSAGVFAWDGTNKPGIEIVHAVSESNLGEAARTHANSGELFEPRENGK